MDFLDILEIMDSLGGSPFEGFGSGIVSGIEAFVGELAFITFFSSAVSILLFIAVIAAAYCFSAFRLLYTGRKAGLKTGAWMPFVPFARTIYRLRILNEQWWKMFIFEECWFYAFIFSLIMLMISLRTLIFVVLIVTVYLVFCLIYNISFRRKFLIAFGIKPMMVLAFTPLYLFYVDIVDTLIGYTDVFRFRGLDGSVISDIIVDDLKQQPHPPVARPVRPQGANIGQTGSIRGVSGMYSGQVFNLAGAEEIVVGRDSTVSNIVLTNNASKISRRHCGVIYDANTQRYSVIDYSSNGTFLDNNTRLVAGQPTPLSRGTIIHLGNRENSFMLE